MALWRSGAAQPVSAQELRDVLAREAGCWLWPDPAEHGVVRPGDAVRVVAPRGTRRALFVVDREGALALSRASTGAVAEVVALFREERELSVEGLAGRALGRGPFARSAAALVALGGRASWWGRQLRASLVAPALGGTIDTGGDLGPAELSPREHAALVPLLRPGARVLDIGCGAGREAIALAALGADVVGIDPSETALAAGRARVPASSRVTLRVGALPDLDADLVGFDLVYLASDVLQVLPSASRARALASCAGALAPGGHLVVPVHAVPATRAVHALLDAPRHALRRLGWRRGVEPGERVVRRDPRHAPSLRRAYERHEEVEALLCSAGLRPSPRVGDFLVARRPRPRLAPHPDVEAGAHDGALLLANLATGATFRLNATGRRVWEGLARGLDRDAIVEAILTLPGAPPARVAHDVDGLLAQLEARGLIAARDDEGSS